MTKPLKDQDVIKNILGIVVGFVILSFLADKDIFAIIGLVIGLIGLIIPKLAKLIVQLWLKLAAGLSWVNAKVILTVMYVVFLLPMSVLYRITSKNPMFLRRTSSETYYTKRDHTYTKADLDKIW